MIALIRQGEAGTGILAQGVPLNGIRFDSIDQALSSTTKITGFLLSSNTKSACKSAVVKILSHPSHYLRPIFLLEPSDEYVHALCEGSGQTWETITEVANSVEEMTKLLPREGDAIDQDEKILRWLFVRQGASIRPVVSFASWRIYVYPLFEIFQPDLSLTTEWIESLKARKLISEKRLVDRIRLCPTCRSSHFNFIDRCPNCKSIAIAKKNFLHCFTCGNVAPEEQCTIHGELKCPKCLSMLRHIGTDYDRALEEHQCSSCGFVFSDPQIVAKCYECSFEGSPDELETQNISELTLTDQGRLAVRSGRLRDVFAVLDSFNFVSLGHFKSSFDWLLALHERKKELMQFSVLALSLDNVNQLVVKHGRVKIVTLIEEFSRRLRQAFRNTDVLARVSENRMAAILPFTPKDNLNIILQRLRDLKVQSDLPDESTLDAKWSVFSLPEDYQNGDTADTILGRMLSGLH